MMEERMNDRRIAAFDRDRADALRRIWFVGDVHGEFRYLAQTLLQAQLRPSWIVFVRVPVRAMQILAVAA